MGIHPGNDETLPGIERGARMIRRFTVTLEGRNRLHLRQLSEEFVNDLWLPAYLTPEQAADFAADSSGGRCCRSSKCSSSASRRKRRQAKPIRNRLAFESGNLASWLADNVSAAASASRPSVACTITDCGVADRSRLGGLDSSVTWAFIGSQPMVSDLNIPADIWAKNTPEWNTPTEHQRPTGSSARLSYGQGYTA